MSRSLPVIAINHQGIREICDESTAILVEPGTIGETVEAIARAILRLSDDDKLRQQLGSSAQQRILDRFTWDSYRKQMHGHYQDALRKKSISLP
jgi:glycosyltransferase involved in cell wall biosynthesis